MMKGLYARLIYKDVMNRKPLEINLQDFLELKGNDLKTYMLIVNAGRCVRREELQEVLQVDDWTMQRSLAWLERDHYIERTKNGWYRKKVFPLDGARRPTKKPLKALPPASQDAGGKHAECIRVRSSMQA